MGYSGAEPRADGAERWDGTTGAGRAAGEMISVDLEIARGNLVP